MSSVVFSFVYLMNINIYKKNINEKQYKTR